MDKVIDRKFKILAVNPCKKGSNYTEREGMFFAAKDAALIPTLHAYYDECRKLGCNEEHLESILLLIDRVDEYQSTINKKTPDTETDCEIDRCIGGVDV
jgi:hypothetical protein